MGLRATATQASGATITVSSTRDSGYVPAGDIFKVAVTGYSIPDPNDIQVLWTASEGITFNNLPTMPWSTSNVTTVSKRGILLPWCFSTSGTKTMRADVWDVRDGAYLGSGTKTFTAREKDADGNLRIVCVGTNSVDMPAGAYGPYADFSDAYDNAAWHTLFLFERGVDHAANSTLAQNRVRDSDLRTGVHFGAYGTGAKPQLPIFWVSDVPGERTVEDVSFVGDYDPSDPANNSGSAASLHFTDGEGTHGPHVFTTLKDVTVSGLEKVYAHSNMVMCDTKVNDYQNYGVYLDGSSENFGVIGCDWSQNPDTVLCNTGKNDGRFAWHALWRCTPAVGDIVFCMGRLFNSASGWTGHPNGLLRYQGADQNFEVSHIVAEGSQLLSSGETGQAGAGSDFEPNHTVVDKVHLIITQSHTNDVMRSAGSRWTNVIYALPDVALSSVYSSTPVDHFLDIGVDDEENLDDPAGPYPDNGKWNINGNADGPFQVASCTFLDYRDATNHSDGTFRACDVSDSINLSGVEVSDTYTWARSASGADETEAGDALSSDFSITPQHTGFRYCPDYTADPLVINSETATATPAEAGRIAYPSSATGVDTRSTIDLNPNDTVDRATDIRPLDDFFGNKRNVGASGYMGAVDPDASTPLVAGEDAY